MKKLVLFLVMVLGVIPAVCADVLVKTKVFDKISQPMLVGGFIENYSSDLISKKGIIVSKNVDDMIVTESTRFYQSEVIIKADGYTAGKVYDTSLFDKRYIDCTGINGEEYACVLQYLLGNTDYYVKAFAIDKEGKIYYGEPVKVTTEDFDRYLGFPDYANVWKAFNNTLFDLTTDEVINPNNGFYYSTNENPTKVSHQVGTSYNTCYKFATEWNYKLWYYHSGHCVQNKIVNMPVMSYFDNKLSIKKNPLDADKDITIYYSINGNYFRPEAYTEKYSGPIEVKEPCTVFCYAISSDNYISYTNVYVIDQDQLDHNFGKIADIVDLGLSVKWASWNIGASKIADYGGLYGAGDPTGLKTSMDEGDYYFKDGESICGTEYDLAHVKWGDNWRIPTIEELLELKEKCAWEYNVTIDGVIGSVATGPNGNTIFIPYAGCRHETEILERDFRGSLFSGNMGTTKYASGYKDLDILNNGLFQMDGCRNWVGQSIRPVYSDDNNSIDLTLRYMGQIIVEGSTITINVEGWASGSGIVSNPFGNSQTGLIVLVNKGGKLSGTAKVEILSNTLNAENVKWTMGSDTYELNNITALEKEFSTDDNGMCVVLFSADKIPTEGSLRAKLTVTIGNKTKTCFVELDFKKKESPDLTVSGKVGEPVDLGLSVKWASWNVGAGAPEEYGNHYAWGELEPKTDYSTSTYEFYNNGYTKYGSIDSKYELDEADDVARQKWGEDWRMPTFGELKELYEKCSFSQEVLNGIPVTKVTGPNGNYIYMPGPGNFTGQTLYFKDNVGSYWSRNLEDDSYAKDLDFFTGSQSLNGDTRYHGQSVRPVYVEAVSGKAGEPVDLGLTSGTLWASCNIGASSPEEYGSYFAWGETAPKSNYDWNTYKFGGGSNFTKYNSSDGLTELELQDDAAYVLLGEGWRMPTHQQELELANECSWESTTLNGVSGYKITGPNGNSIFMPRGGLYDGTDYDADGTKVSDANTGGWYWSSTLNAAGSSYAQGLCFFPSLLLNVIDHERCDGHNIRPVYVGNVQQTESVKITDIGKTTYCSNYDLDFTNVQGIKAYIAIGYDDIDKTIWLARVMKVPAGTGLLLKGNAGTYKIPHANVRSTYVNYLKGNLGDQIKIEETDGDKTNYYLSGKDGTFVSVNGSANIGKNKAYLQLPTSVFGGTRSIGISYDDEDGTTSIKNLTPALSEGEGAWYTLQGQRVAKPGKGLYIHNGKKVVIK